MQRNGMENRMMKKEHGCFWCPFRKGRICSDSGFDILERTSAKSIKDLKETDLGDTINEGYRCKRYGYECYDRHLKEGKMPEWRIA